MDRQLFRQAIDWPELPASERDLAGHQHQHLHEAHVVGASFDFGNRKLGIMCRDHDRRAQARIPAEPMITDPIVGGAAEHGGHVFAVHDLGTVQAVENAKPRLVTIQHMRLHRFQRRSRLLVAVELPVRAARQRRVLGIARKA